LVGYSHYLPDIVGHSHYLPIKGNSASFALLWCHSHYLPIHSHYLADPTATDLPLGTTVYHSKRSIKAMGVSTFGV
jgi:hypothetical protein